MLEYDSQHAQIERIRILPHVVNPLFWLAVGLAEALLFVAILPLLLVYCVYYRGGFEWQADNTYTTMFNIHPLTMVLGFIILYSQGQITCCSYTQAQLSTHIFTELLTASSSAVLSTLVRRRRPGAGICEAVTHIN